MLAITRKLKRSPVVLKRQHTKALSFLIGKRFNRYIKVCLKRARKARELNGSQRVILGDRYVEIVIEREIGIYRIRFAYRIQCKQS